MNSTTTVSINTTLLALDKTMIKRKSYPLFLRSDFYYTLDLQSTVGMLSLSVTMLVILITKAALHKLIDHNTRYTKGPSIGCDGVRMVSVLMVWHWQVFAIKHQPCKLQTAIYTDRTKASTNAPSQFCLQSYKGFSWTHWLKFANQGEWSVKQASLLTMFLCTVRVVSLCFWLCSGWGYVSSFV